MEVIPGNMQEEAGLDNWEVDWWENRVKRAKAKTNKDCPKGRCSR
jgi:hypothetical protein